VSAGVFDRLRRAGIYGRARDGAAWSSGTTDLVEGTPMDTSAHSAAAIRELHAVRQRRAELRDTLDALERALAAPGASRAVAWGEQLHAAVDRLASDFAMHVEVTEGPDGLHQAILAGDLRLANQVDALSGEHKTIAADIAALSAVSEEPVTPADVDGIRERGTSVLGRLVRHRQRGADLIYEAYQTDIGGGD
jgi:hypothetical protein